LLPTDESGIHLSPYLPYNGTAKDELLLGRSRGHLILRACGIVKQLAEKVALAVDFGWRSAGVPSTPGFGVMGWSGSPLR